MTTITKSKTEQRLDTVLGVLGLWVARMVAGVLMFAGAVHILSGVDMVIAYSAAGVLTFYLLKEIL